MKLIAISKCLLWTGEVDRQVQDVEYAAFCPDLTHCFREVIETGDINFNNLETDRNTTMYSLRSIFPGIVYNGDYNPDLICILGEYYPTLGIQWVYYLRNAYHSEWVKTDHDLAEDI